MATRLQIFLWLSLLALVSVPVRAAAAGLGMEILATNAASLTHVTSARDGTGRLFVVEKSGRIQIFKDGAYLEAAFLELRSRVSAPGEGGMLSVAFPPDFKLSQVFYVWYTDGAGGLISRFNVGANKDVAIPASEKVILRLPTPGIVHNGGQLAFGPDNLLYISVGDGGTADSAQDPRSFLGKLLRIDVLSGAANYTVPPSNPFVGNAKYRPEIWAMGLRNPWRFSFDRTSGDLYVADVGNARAEEINFQPSDSKGGENYGWPYYEGNFVSRPEPAAERMFTFPVATLTNRSDAVSIIGGFVSRAGKNEPFDGAYIYGDHGRNLIFALKQEGSKWTNFVIGAADPYILITSFGEDEAGQIHAVGTINNLVPPGTPARLDSVLVKLVPSNRALPPRIVPSFGEFDRPQKIQLTERTPGSMLHYTVDSSDPTEDSPSVRSGEFIEVTRNGVLRVRAISEGYDSSAIAAGSYSFKLSVTLNPAGSVTNGTLLQIIPSVPTATVRYTLDGGELQLYSGLFPVNGNQRIRVTAEHEGWRPYQGGETFIGLLIPETVIIEKYAGSGTQGARDGFRSFAEFDQPSSIVRAKDGAFFLLDGAGKRLRMISPEGDVRTLGASFTRAVSMAFDEDGVIYISDSGANRIYRILVDGELEAFAGTTEAGMADGPRLEATLSDLGSIAVRGKEVYFVNGSFLRVVGTNGMVSTTESQVSGLAGLLVKDDALHVFSYSGFISVTDSSGAARVVGSANRGHSDSEDGVARFGPWSQSIPQAPRTFTADSDGSIFASDGNVVRHISGFRRVSTLVEEPRLPTQEDSPIRFISGTSFGVEGLLYVSDWLSHSIYRISADRDNDSVADHREAAPLTVGVDDRHVDSDGDGVSNSHQFLAGMDPSQTPIELSAKYEGERLLLSWSENVNFLVRIQHSGDLIDWAYVNQEVMPTGTAIELSGGQQFFRLQIERR